MHFNLIVDFPTTTESEPENKNMIKMSEFIKKFLEHFKQPDAMNTPLPVPDPMVMPDRTYPLGVKVTTTNVTAYGISRLRIENFTSNVVEMKVPIPPLNVNSFITFPMFLF